MAKTKEEKYVRNIEAPMYTPQLAEKPEVASLYDKTKYLEMVAEINASNLSDEDKLFLKFASTRHIKFDYGLIAEYYAHSDNDVQEFMEKNGLVIIDFDKAIEYGYVQVSKSLMGILGRDDEK